MLINEKSNEKTKEKNIAKFGVFYAIIILIANRVIMKHLNRQNERFGDHFSQAFAPIDWSKLFE